MNGLTLRISRGGANKSKNSIGFSPVNITTSSLEDAGVNNELCKKFADATSTDEQLTILKTALDQFKEGVDSDVIQFMVLVFLQADAKHPIKSFISRQVTKNSHLQNPFTDALALKITAYIATVPSDYKEYVDVVSRVATCLENFNAGVSAVRLVETNLAAYLKDCLELCVKILSESKTLSPTEKNEIFNLAHLSLRLLLHIVQKANDYSYYKLTLMFSAIRSCIQSLMFDDDVPMDTKSVCGILYLSMHIMENGWYSWIDILNPKSCDITLLTLLTAEASQLCLYSALATVVSVDKLESDTLDDDPVILILLDKILDIGERSSSESTFILGVTRTLLQISKMLNQIVEPAIGLSIVDSLLMFAWSHLEHYMDSVRHLTAQILSTVVSYCAMLDKEGDDTALTKLLTSLRSLDTSRKSFYVSVSCLITELGARRVLHTWPTLIHDVLHALGSQHIQASARTLLEKLVAGLATTCSTREVQSLCVRALLSHVRAHSLPAHTLALLETLLLTAVTHHHHLLDHIIPYIRQWSASQPQELKCVLMLLSVARKSGGANKLCASKLDANRLGTSYSEHEWKGIIGYNVLKQAAIDAEDETRILALTLIVESPKTTEEFTVGDLSFILYYLKYNINAQAPNFRQLTLSVLKKFIKRLEDSYKVIKRQKDPNAVEYKVEYYLRFVEELRQQCFDSLLPGANYSRRYVALQLLVWCERLQLEGYNRTWKPDYVEKLLLHLEDSYENNKAFALEVLGSCPVDIVKNNTYSISIDIKDVIAQASSLKPTDCVSAAYKLDYISRRLPESILQDKECSATDPVMFTLIDQLMCKVREELVVCQQSVVLAARSAPMYGLLHCVTHLMSAIDCKAISSDPQWTSLVGDMISTCMAVNAGVSCVVNNSSPEGHLPMDMSGVVVTDDGNSGGVMLDDGRQVTAQMVLLCAWRSVKEVSLLLGLISSRLSIAGEDGPVGTLTAQQLAHIGEHFTTLLAETKHRGAFEQAYVGFTKLLARLWRCRSTELHSLPQSWLTELTRIIASGEKKDTLCATRRSAGLPFMIQALVTTELHVQSNPKCFQWCMSTLLSAARSSTSEESRAHALNIVRALFRSAALDESVAPFVGDGLMLALAGFERHSWAERNSSTLLFSALMVRVFGVQRSRDTDALCTRNRMTGRIFFLRYPHLYDFMLDKLQEVTSSKDTQVLRPSLYPILLLLARLYPSSLEGTVSNLKLVAFIPHVLSCAASAVLNTRQLAAKAMLPLISPENYITHIKSMFNLLIPTIKRNYCHGILLQLVRLLDARPEDLDNVDVLHGSVETTLWVLEQAIGSRPCYLIVDEYVKMINVMVWRFSSLLQNQTISKIVSHLDRLLFNAETPQITSGREICLANAIYLQFILLNKDIHSTCELVFKGLQHASYEVVLSTLNYLLMLHGNSDENMDKLQEHLSSIANKSVLNTLKKHDQYIQLLCKVLKNDYIECQQKCLKILTLEGNTQRLIIEAKDDQISDEIVIEKLFECLQNSHEKLTHVYLESLLNFVSNKLIYSTLSAKVMLDVIRVVFEYSSSDNSEDTRGVIVKFIEGNIEQLLNFDSTELSDEERFELKVTTWCTIITLLEDDEESLRQRVSESLTSQGRVTSQGGVTSRLVAAACAEYVRDCVERDSDSDRLALYCVIALLDFKSVVVTDDGNDECRVFDQNERYNIFLEETVWTNACADKIIYCYNQTDDKLLDRVSSTLDNPVYKGVFEKLCQDNVVAFKKMLAGDKLIRNDALNPKIELFYNRLSS